MSNIKDFINNPGDNVASIAYILIMSNVLGLTAYMMSNKSTPLVNKLKDKNPVVINNTRESNPRVIEKNIQEKKQVLEDRAQESCSSSEEKVIEFSETARLRKNKIRDFSKPLVWRFPKSNKDMSFIDR